MSTAGHPWKITRETEKLIRFRSHLPLLATAIDLLHSLGNTSEDAQGIHMSLINAGRDEEHDVSYRLYQFLIGFDIFDMMDSRTS